MSLRRAAWLLVVLCVAGCRESDHPGDIVAVEEPGGALPCASLDRCDAAYRDYARRAGKGSTAVSAAELDRLATELYDIHPITPSLAPPPEQIRAVLAEAAGLTELLAGLDERKLDVAQLDESPWPGGRKLLLRFDDPWVGRFTGLLLLPDGPGPHPAVIVHPGHGEDAAWTLDNRLGAAFPAAGVAVLVLEARVHAGDEYGSALTRDLLLRGRPLVGLRVYEVLLLERYLRSRDDIDPRRLGLAGHSGGSLVANLAMRLEPRFLALCTDLESGYWSVDDEGSFIDESAVGLVPYQAIINEFGATDRAVLQAEYGYRSSGEGQVLRFFSDTFGLRPVQPSGLVRGCLERATCTSPYLGVGERAARSVVGGVSTGGDAPPLPGIAVVSWLLTNLGAQGAAFVPEAGEARGDGDRIEVHITDEFLGDVPGLLFRPPGETRAGVVLHPGRGDLASAEQTARALAADGYGVLLLEPRVARADALELELHRALGSDSVDLHGLRAYEILAGASALRSDEQLEAESVAVVGRCYGADLARMAVTLAPGPDALVELRPADCPSPAAPLGLTPPSDAPPLRHLVLATQALTPDVVTGLLAP